MEIAACHRDERGHAVLRECEAKMFHVKGGGSLHVISHVANGDSGCGCVGHWSFLWRFGSALGFVSRGDWEAAGTDGNEQNKDILFHNYNRTHYPLKLEFRIGKH